MWIETVNHRKFDFTNVTVEQVHIDDILHAICRIPRFNGHTPLPYTVGQHTLHCLQLTEFQAAKPYILIHDFAEAYVGDMPSPLKALMPGFPDLETRVQNAIQKAFGLNDYSARIEEEVRRVDLLALSCEKEFVLGGGTNWDMDLPMPHSIPSFIQHGAAENIQLDLKRWCLTLLPAMYTPKQGFGHPAGELGIPYYERLCIECDRSFYSHKGVVVCHPCRIKQQG